MNPCPTPPVCEFGGLGPEARYWYPPHVFEHWGCRLCGVPRRRDDLKCWPNIGGVWGMCGHRPITELERLLGIIRGDRMGPRPEVDTVNVVPCDGTLMLRCAR